MKKNFKIADDGTIDRTDSFNEDRRASLDNEILEIIEINSYSKGLLSAYKGQKLANEICKEKYNHKNHKEYVEMLMQKKYPKEAEKARLGASFVLLNWFGLPLSLCALTMTFACMVNELFWIAAFLFVATIVIIRFYIVISINIRKKIKNI